MDESSIFSEDVPTFLKSGLRTWRRDSAFATPWTDFLHHIYRTSRRVGI